MLELLVAFVSSGALNGMVVCKEAGQEHRDALGFLLLSVEE